MLSLITSVFIILESSSSSVRLAQFFEMIGCSDGLFLVQYLLSNSTLHDRGFSFERNCVLRRWESETLKWIISHKVDKVD